MRSPAALGPLLGHRAAVQPSVSTHAPLPADRYDSTGSGARKRPRSCHPAAGTLAEPSPAEPETEGAAEAPSPGHENLGRGFALPQV